MIEDETYENAIQAMTEINARHGAHAEDSSAAFRIDRKLGHEIVRSLALDTAPLDDIVPAAPPTRRRKRPRLCLDGAKRCSRNTIKARMREIEHAICAAIRGAPSADSTALRALSAAEAKVCIKVLSKSRVLSGLVAEIGEEVLEQSARVAEEVKAVKAVVVEQRKYLKKQAPGGAIYERRMRRQSEAVDKVRAECERKICAMEKKHAREVEEWKRKLCQSEQEKKQKIEQLRRQMFQAGVGRSVCEIQGCERFSRGKIGRCYKHANAKRKCVVQEQAV